MWFCDFCFKKMWHFLFNLSRRPSSAILGPKDLDSAIFYNLLKGEIKKSV